MMTVYEERGLERGLARGLEKGREEGRIRGKQEAVLKVLEVRFAAVPEEVRAAIGSVSTDAELDELLQSAACIEALSELFVKPR
jgi:predicted transposase YdaD